MNFRPLKNIYEREVIYTESHWKLLEEKRLKALKILECLQSFECVVHGSVARGDVRIDSDVEIAFLKSSSPYMIITKLEQCGFNIHHYELIVATPKTTPKLYIYLDEIEEQVVTLPLTKLSRIEEYFYKYSGCLSFEELKRGARVPGVNKNLLLIIPTEKGHKEYSVIGNEVEVSRILKVPVELVLERIEMLTRRAEKGRTGLYLRREIHPNEPLEEITRRLLKGLRVEI